MNERPEILADLRPASRELTKLRRERAVRP